MSLSCKKWASPIIAYMYKFSKQATLLLFRIYRNEIRYSTNFVSQEELDLTAPNKAAMLSLPPQKKWQIYCSRKGGEDLVDQARAPEHYIERLRTLATVRHFLLLLSMDWVTRTAHNRYMSDCNYVGIAKDVGPFF